MPHLNLRDISHSEITASGLKTFQSQVNNKTWLTAMSKYSRVRFQDKLQLLQSHHAVFYSLRLHSFCHLISSDRLETIVQTAAVFWRRRCLAESLALQRGSSLGCCSPWHLMVAKIGGKGHLYYRRSGRVHTRRCLHEKPPVS